jgi:hypothetical protein
MLVTYGMRLADSILALHEQILEVYVLEERDGQNVVIDEASKSGASLLADGMNQMGRNAPLSPSIILGAASQILQGSRPTKLVGILYLGGGVVLSPIDENRVLIASTTPSSLFEVMERITEFLPRITRSGLSATMNMVSSASQAEERVIAFLTNRSHHHPITSIRIDEVAYVNAEQLWNVNGSLQGRVRRKQFHLEMDGRDGSIVRFSSPSSTHLGMILIEVACLLAAAILLVWILYSKL